ncbi:MAG: 3-deoxy-D-manno-octulosonic acid transferase [Desulfatirhabdiaceae bacterium]
MHSTYRIYQIFSSLAVIAGFPPFWLYSRLTGRHRDGLSQRLGRYSPVDAAHIQGSPRFWIHAASMGEVMAADALIDHLRLMCPGCAIILSTVTEHGYRLAEKQMSGNVYPMYAPIDFIPAVSRTMRIFRPDILAFMETELWPNWIMTAHGMGIKTVLINGRISRRSIGGYLKIRPMMSELLNHMSGFSMIQAGDAARICQMGAPAARVMVNGNAKYDRLLNQTNEMDRQPVQWFLDRLTGRPVFLGGSIRQEEYRMLISVFEDLQGFFPDLLLILAPRHLGRLPDICRELSARGIGFQKRTDIGSGAITTPVLVLDTMGELKDLYRVADVVFCGGSLAPKGGQNVMEPAAWGKPVLFGPHMDDFLDARDMLEATGGGRTVADTRALFENVRLLLTHPDQAAAMGSRARIAVESNRGAAKRHARFMVRQLTSSDMC